MSRSEETDTGQRKVAVVYPFMYHFREPVFRALCKQSPPGPEYVLFSGRNSPVAALQLIDPALASRSVSKGGLRWRFFRNVWLGKKYLWQSGAVRLALSAEFDTIVYYGFISILSTWISALLARLRGKRVLLWTHGPYRHEWFLKRWYQNLFFKLGHGLLLFGNRGRNQLIKRGFSPDRLYVAFNSLDYDRQCQLREKLTAEILAGRRGELFPRPEQPLLMFVGRLVARKRLDLLLQAAAALADGGQAVNILIIGDGPEQGRLEQLAAELGLSEAIRFQGPCHDEEQLATLIGMSDLCVSPAAIGLTAIHALVYGVPVITHDQAASHGPEFEAILPGVNGEVFRRDDVADLTRVIRSWLTRLDANGATDQRGKAETRARCYEVVDRYYNPHFQVKVINAAAAGIAATQLPLGEDLTGKIAGVD